MSPNIAVKLSTQLIALAKLRVRANGRGTEGASDGIVEVNIIGYYHTTNIPATLMWPATG